MVRVILILIEVDDKDIPLMNISSVGKIPTDEPAKDTRLVMYLQLGKMSMDFSEKKKTQGVCKLFHPEVDLYTFCKAINHSTKVLRSYEDQNSLVTQSANLNFISLARKFSSMSDCMEWLYIPLNLVVFVSKVYK